MGDISVNEASAGPRALAWGDAAADSGLALWRRIADALRQDMGSGESALPPGARLPTEAVLSARFGVNRHTVRRALEDLSRAGLIRVERGRGMFVAEDIFDYTVGVRTRFSEWVRRHNKEPSGQVLRLEEIAATDAIAAGLKVAMGDPVVVLERLGFADDMPVCLSLHHFPAARLAGIQRALAATDRITAALVSVGVQDYVRQVTRVTARSPTSVEAARLRMARARPVLVTESVNVDRAGTVVEFSFGCYPTPRVQIVFEP